MNRLPSAISIVVSVAACAGPRAAPTHPEDMTAQEHREAAGAQDELAQQAPFLRRREAGRWWAFSWDSGNEHRAARDAHLGAAETLEARYRAACKGLPIAAESVSPLERDVLETTPSDQGVVVTLSADAGPAETVLAEIRCHWSWLQLEPRVGADDDVVAIDGLVYEAVLRDEVLEVTVTAPDADALVELQRRAALVVRRDR